MLRLLIIVTCLSAVSVGCTITREKQAEIKDAAGTVGTFLGLPRPVGEGIAALTLAAITGIGGHKNGRRCERKAQADDGDDACPVAPGKITPAPAGAPVVTTTGPTAQA